MKIAKETKMSVPYVKKEVSTWYTYNTSVLMTTATLFLGTITATIHSAKKSNRFLSEPHSLSHRHN